MKSPAKLTPKQKHAIELIAKGFSLRMVGEAVEVTTLTVRNWKKIPLFKKELAEAINLRAESSNYRLHDLYRKSLEECEGLLEDPNPTIRLGAARLVAESYAQVVRVAEERAALEQIEARMEQLAADMSGTNQMLMPVEDAEFEELESE